MTQPNTGNFAGEAAAAVASLPKTTFKIPESARTATDPKTITIRQLTFNEEKAAMEAKEHGGGSFALEGCKRAICAADGNPITWTDNQAESFFMGLSNKVRDLAVQGFVMVALPNKSEADDFLGSAQTTV
jgi:hypothetical protein